MAYRHAGPTNNHTSQPVIVSILTYATETWDLHTWLKKMKTEGEITAFDILAAPAEEETFEHRWVIIVFPTLQAAESYQQRVRTKLHATLRDMDHKLKKLAIFGTTLHKTNYRIGTAPIREIPEETIEAIKMELALTLPSDRRYEYLLEDNFATLTTIAQTITPRLANS